MHPFCVLQGGMSTLDANTGPAPAKGLFALLEARDLEDLPAAGTGAARSRIVRRLMRMRA
ncbi:MAG: hypothetical protein IT514_12170 [Burkholderiales bacterium]|nr:hypothetical protein [Burkholderiales bacterium]